MYMSYYVSNRHFGVVKSLLMRGAKMQYKDAEGRNLAQVMLEGRAEDEVCDPYGADMVINPYDAEISMCYINQGTKG